MFRAFSLREQEILEDKIANRKDLSKHRAKLRKQHAVTREWSLDVHKSMV